jgi:hypothetical protein
VATFASRSPLAPGRYTVRAEMRSNMGASAMQTSTIATVPAATPVAGSRGQISTRRTSFVHAPTDAPMASITATPNNAHLTTPLIRTTSVA